MNKTLYQFSLRANFVILTSKFRTLIFFEVKILLFANDELTGIWPNNDLTLIS